MGRRSQPPKSKGRTFTKSVTGKLSVTSRGFGFVNAPDGEFHVSRRDMNGAMDGDVVVARVTPGSGGGRGQGQYGAAASVSRVLERRHTTIVGTYHEHDAFGVVTPRNRHIGYDGFVERGRAHGAPDGAIVVAEILSYPTRSEAMQVSVSSVVTIDADDPRAIIDTIIAEHGIPVEFSDACVSTAEALTLNAEETLRREPHRRDIRTRDIFTIDPADARDFDDAIDVEWVDGLVRLGVHIADVSTYVPWDGAVDDDARVRGTSVYLPDRVIPMLPEALSNNLCSLRPNEDRLAFTVDMFLDGDGVVARAELYQSVIRSKRRYSYDEVLAMLEGRVPFDGDAARGSLELFEDVANRLEARRARAGSLDFDAVEPKVRLDEEGRPIEVIVRTANRATEMIEHAMILANETVATHLERAGWPVVYRVHENPEPTALDGLWPLLTEFGYQLPADHEVTPKLYQRIIAASHDKPEAYLVSMLLLRTLKQAYYSPKNRGHFGLASEAYAHFTSPIRRYPDLVVHRLLAAQLRGERTEDMASMIAELEALAGRSSDAERNAEQAEREATKYKLCEYMAGREGERFAGIISNVASFGLFVTLDIAVDGLVHIGTMRGDTWAYDAQRHILRGHESRVRYRLGQRVAVELVRVDLANARLDFEILGRE